MLDPTNSQIAYAVRNGNGAGAGHLLRTTNGGASWANITANLPDIPTWSFALDPKGSGTADDVYYVGNDAGVYQTFATINGAIVDNSVAGGTGAMRGRAPFEVVGL